MTSRFTDRILKHLSSDSYKPETVAQIAEDLRIDDEDRDSFKQAIHELEVDERLVVHQKGHVFLPSFRQGEKIVGSFRKNERGFGFLIPEKTHAEGDLFVPAHSTGDAMTGDTVEVRVNFSKRRGGDDRSPFTGEVVRVISRRR